MYMQIGNDDFSFVLFLRSLAGGSGGRPRTRKLSSVNKPNETTFNGWPPTAALSFRVNIDTRLHYILPAGRC